MSAATKQDRIVAYLKKKGWYVAGFTPTKGVIALSTYQNGGCPHYFVSRTGCVRYGLTYKTAKPQRERDYQWLRDAAAKE